MSSPMTPTRIAAVAPLARVAPLALAAALVLTACGGEQSPGAVGPAPHPGGHAAADVGHESTHPAEVGDGSASGHGAVEGASEVSEPQLHLATVDAEGGVGMLDLLDGTASQPGTIAPPTSLTTDGRYLFAGTDGGVDVVDTGVWTWDHGDHSHFYRAAPHLLGRVAGEGPAVVTTSGNATTGGTGLLFTEAGRAVLLSNAALSRGEIAETFRIPVEPHRGVVAPFGDGALVTVPDAAGVAAEVRFHQADGTAVEATTTSCPDARGAITTRVGVVIGCSDGALLATGDGGTPELEKIAYPQDAATSTGAAASTGAPSASGPAAPPATEFRGRKGRPTVAAPAGDSGFWLLDTRAREWRFVPTGEPLVQVAAVDDTDQHVVALDSAGRIRVYYGADGTEIAATPPLISGDAERSGIDLTLGRERAYLSDPVAGVVYEIDFRGDARVAREIETATAPDFVAVTGR